MIVKMLLAAICALPLAAMAQRADCPTVDAPMPTAPPGPPPSFYPPAAFPKNLGAAVAPMAGGLADAARTPLASWRYVGHSEERQTSRAYRLYRSADGSLLSVMEWDYKSDGGAVMTNPGMNNRTVGAYPAGMHGMRAPSGCVSSSLNWIDGRKHYKLEIAGPLDLEAQRATLMQVAEAIAAQ